MNLRFTCASALPTRQLLARTAGALAVGAVMASTGLAEAQSAPGVGDNEILIGGVFAQSGQFRFVTEPYERGLRSVFDATNEAGGIHGRKIKWIVEDDGYQPSRSLAGAKKLVERDGVFAIVGQVGTPTIAAILPYTEQTGTPVLTINPLPPPPPKYAFNIMASFSELSFQLTKHLLTHQGVKQLGYLYQNDDLGEMGRIGLTRALKSMNASLAADVGYERGAADLSTQVLRLRDAKVDAVVVMATAPAIATAIKQANIIDFRPIWATHGAVGTDIVYKLLGDQTEGLMFATETESQFADTPGVRNALATVRKYFPNATIDYNMLVGYANGKLAVGGLKAAGRDLSRDKLVRAVEGLNDFDAEVVRLSFSASKHSGANAVRIFRWQGGRPIAQSDWLPIEEVKR
jgi:branched-chain amino acid transport system substrate-binding protein